MPFKDVLGRSPLLLLAVPRVGLRVDVSSSLFDTYWNVSLGGARRWFWCSSHEGTLQSAHLPSGRGLAAVETEAAWARWSLPTVGFPPPSGFPSLVVTTLPNCDGSRLILGRGWSLMHSCCFAESPSPCSVLVRGRRPQERLPRLSVSEQAESPWRPEA